MKSVHPLYPMRATVVPRACSPETGELLPITDIVESMLRSKVKFLRLQGRGKTTALQHIAAECDDLPNLVLLEDGPTNSRIDDYPDAQLFVFSCKLKQDDYFDVTIAPWNQDDVIEYLLAKHPKQCKSVMAKLSAHDENWFADGDPGIWSAVLDQMAGNEQIGRVSDAILEEIRKCHPQLLDYRRIAELCTKHVDNADKVFSEMLARSHFSCTTTSKKLLRCSGVRVLIAANQITKSIREKSGFGIFFQHRWPNRLYEFVSSKFMFDSDEFQFLKKLASTPGDSHAAVAAGLVVRIDCMWRPEKRSLFQYSKASLPNVQWNNVRIVGSNLEMANLAGAKLSGAQMASIVAGGITLARSDLVDANLARASLMGANFSGANANRANLSLTKLHHARLGYADFSHADLQGANLYHADLHEVNFTKACLNTAKLKLARIDGANFFCASLSKATLDELDFSNCRLDFAVFTKAMLQMSSFEGCSVSHAVFEHANCQKGSFTGSRFRSVVMANCNLSGAQLAEIDWEGCNLRGVNFDGATFHLGSTRCGLVDSPFASHGTRTGFYTDEYDEHYFRRPEEIRKANLCGCDLTGAKVFNADFYMIDLRDATYDAEQYEHFQKCGAILN